jgi:hypothetical protein
MDGKAIGESVKVSLPKSFLVGKDLTILGIFGEEGEDFVDCAISCMEKMNGQNQ